MRPLAALSRLWRRRPATAALPYIDPAYDMEAALRHRRALRGANHDRSTRAAVTKQHDAFARDRLRNDIVRL